MIEVIYLVRHAFRSNFTVDPETGVYTSPLARTPTGIPTDPPLTAKGVEQARELAAYLLAIEPPVDVVYSSPFYRCLQTIRPVTNVWFGEGEGAARRIKGGVRVDGGIGEFFGRAPWNHPAPPTLAQLATHFPHLDHSYRASGAAPPSHGESVAELHQRVERALEQIIGALDQSDSGDESVEDGRPPRTVLLCTHAATMIAAGRALTGRMPVEAEERDFSCFTAGLSKFVRRKGEGEGEGVLGSWDCVMDSETGFLSGGAERGWHFNGEESFVSVDKTATGEEEAEGSKL